LFHHIQHEIIILSLVTWIVDLFTKIHFIKYFIFLANSQYFMLMFMLDNTLFSLSIYINQW